MYSTGEGMAKEGYVFIEMDREETGCMSVEWIQLT
jgi:hypothetical protein